MKNKLIIFLVLALALAGIVYFAVGDKANDDSAMQDVVGSQISVTTTINDGQSERSYPSTITSGSSAMEVLSLIASDGILDVKTTVYDFGTIVDSIDGVGIDTTDNTYWIYYVNGVTASVGASEYIVADGDTILWNYEASL